MSGSNSIISDLGDFGQIFDISICDSKHTTQSIVFLVGYLIWLEMSIIDSKHVT